MKFIRNGLITKKLGTIQIFKNNGTVELVTLILVLNNIVLDANFNHHSFNLVTLCVKNDKLKLVNKNIYKIFHDIDFFPKKILKKFKTDKIDRLRIGDRISSDFFRRSQNIDVSGISIGKGFSGAIKRYGFKGLPATHGVSASHRSLGSTGQCQDPGRVFKGKKMSGHMGSNNVSIKNLKIIDIDYELGIILVKGMLPGFKNSYLYIKDSKKCT